MVTRFQLRILHRSPKWPASKPTAARIFRNDFIAAAFANELEAQGMDIVAIERREYAVGPWQPFVLGRSS